MTISALTLKSSDHEPARRCEVFTGTGRRREWSPDEQARIVAESYETGETVSAVARRYPEPGGGSEQREVVAAWLTSMRMNVDPSSFLITVGGHTLLRTTLTPFPKIRRPIP